MSGSSGRRDSSESRNRTTASPSRTRERVSRDDESEPDWSSLRGFPLDTLLPDAGPTKPPDYDPNIPWYIERLGQAGILLALTALALAILGITTMLFGPYTPGIILVTLAITAATLAMLLGILYHASYAPHPLHRDT